MRTTAAILLAVALAAPTASGEDLPRPPSLQPQVDFWTRIYAEVDSHGGLLHDVWHMDVVYEEIRVPDGLSRRSRERYVERTKKKYVNALKLLGAGRRSNLNALQKRVLALWPPDVANSTLRAAARQVRFQRGQADRFREGVIRAGLYEPTIREVFAQKGLPADLAAMPHVESSFNPRAYSSVGAAGLWQFTRSTGRLYMRVDYEIDERMDPFRATEAASRLLLDNYAELKTWPLAVTAYNHGQAGMSRAVRATGTRDIATIVRRYKGPAFKFASRNFYTELLAAIDVDRNAETYFGTLEKLDPAAYETVKLDHYYRVQTLVRVLGIDATRLREENLSLQPPVWRGQKYVPRGFELRIPRHPRGVPAVTALASIPPSERFTRQKRDTVYRVRRGDTLSQIAKRHGVKQSELVALNGLRSRHRIRIGQKLRLPSDDAPSMPPGDFDGTYYVRRGDNLSRIAKRYHVSEDAIVAANGLRNKNRLSVGQKLLVPVPSLVAAASKPAPAPTPKPVSRPTPAPPPIVPGAPAGVTVAHAERGEDGKPRVRVTLPASGPAASVPWSNPDAPADTGIAAGPAATPAPVAAAAAGPTTAAVEPPGLPLEPSPAKPPPPVARAAAGPASPAPARSGTPEDVLAGLDLGVSKDDHIVVEAGETLGHYADWLEISTSRLRTLNGLRPRAALVIGQRVRLDFSRVARSAFAARRNAHHEAIRADFFARYRVAGTQEHVLRRGDTLWSLSRRHRSVPIWLLREYNPDLDLRELRPGLRIQIPRLERINT